jgi:hypothetical protein
MIDLFKAVFAVVCVVFFLALGAFGGCLAGLSTQSGSGVVMGLIGGAIAGLWVGFLIARKLL